MALTTVRPQGMGFNTGRRNLIINGAMQVVQRGTVSGLTGSSYGGPDRFRLGLSGAGTHRILQSATVPSGAGFASSWRLDCTTADTSITSADQISCQYRIEGQDLQELKKGTSSAEKVTLSFWVRSSLTGTYVVELNDKDNTRHIAKTYTISQADTFEYKTLTFDGDTTGTLDNDSQRSFQINWWLAAGSTYTSGTLATSWASEVSANRAAGLNVNLASSTDNNWYLTGVQLEVGSNASDFEHRSFGEELAACQRYYQKTFAYATVPAQNLDTYSGSIMGVARSVTSTSAWEPCGTWDLAVSMRATPSIVSFNPYVANAEWGNSSAVSSSNFRVLASTADRISCDNTGNTVNFGSNNPAIQLTAEAEL
tara:strand:- start:1046 stop:2149 length:1104 start_codon:yes stop_codon:yes gene_type:complete